MTTPPVTSWAVLETKYGYTMRRMPLTIWGQRSDFLP